MTVVVVRAARKDEAGVLLDLWARAGEDAARPSDEPDAVVRLVERDPEALVVADPDVRGRGTGGLLVARAEQRLRALGAQRFCAMVVEVDDLGREFWVSRGYQPQNDWRRWVKAASS